MGHSSRRKQQQKKQQQQKDGRKAQRDGRPQGSPGAAGEGLRQRHAHHEELEQNLWFITSMDSAKIEELLRDPRACITMQKNGEYISLSGNVHVSNDKGGIEEIWKEAYRPWFPEGKDTPDLVLLKVDTTWGV